MSDPVAVERAYYVISGLYTLAASLVWGVNTLFLLDAGLDIFGVFVANAAYTAGMVVFEIPTGVLADTKGRRISFLASLAILALATGAYVAAAWSGWGLGSFVAISVLLGLGYTFYSGAVEAWLVDALAETGYAGGLDRIFARGGLVTGAAMLVGTVAGGLLGELDLAIPFLVRSGLLVLVFGYSWMRLHDLGFTPRAVSLRGVPAEMRAVAVESIVHGWRRPSMRLIMAMSFVQLGVVNWAWYAWQPYVVELAETDTVWFVGVIAALLSVALMAGNALVGWLSRRCGRRTTLLIWAAVGAASGSTLVGLATTVWAAVAAFLLFGLSLGVAQPVKQAYVHGVVPSSVRASVVSFESMIGNAGGVGGQLGLGALSRSGSIASAYVASGLALVVMVPIALVLRSRQDTADVIVGDQAGVGSACAAQGLPEVLGVDADVLSPTIPDT